MLLDVDMLSGHRVAVAKNDQRGRPLPIQLYTAISGREHYGRTMICVPKLQRGKYVIAY